MSWRAELEDRFTVICEHCHAELIEPARRPGQKYLLGRPCPSCGYLRPRGS